MHFFVFGNNLKHQGREGATSPTAHTVEGQKDPLESLCSQWTNFANVHVYAMYVHVPVCYMYMYMYMYMHLYIYMQVKALMALGKVP